MRVESRDSQSYFLVTALQTSHILFSSHKNHKKDKVSIQIMHKIEVVLLNDNLMKQINVIKFINKFSFNFSEKSDHYVQKFEENHVSTLLESLIMFRNSRRNTCQLCSKVSTLRNVESSSFLGQNVLSSIESIFTYKHIVGNARSVCSATIANLLWLELTCRPNLIRWCLIAWIVFILASFSKCNRSSARSFTYLPQ